MTARAPPAKGGINWAALGVILNVSLALLNGVGAFLLFNSAMVRDVSEVTKSVAVLTQQVAGLERQVVGLERQLERQADDLREAERDRRRRPGE